MPHPDTSTTFAKLYIDDVSVVDRYEEARRQKEAAKKKEFAKGEP